MKDVEGVELDMGGLGSKTKWVGNNGFETKWVERFGFNSLTV